MIVMTVGIFFFTAETVSDLQEKMKKMNFRAFYKYTVRDQRTEKLGSRFTI